MVSMLTHRGRAGQGQQAERVILDVDSVEALRNAAPTISTLNPGDKGRIVISGPGLGLAADMAGVEATWRTMFSEKGFSVQDVHGEGFSTAIVEWSVPADTIANQQGVPMHSPVLAIVLVGAILAVVLFLGWLVLGRLQVFLLGQDGQPGLLTGLPGIALLAGIGVLVAMGLGARRRSSA